jgi:hypothetical protein
MLNKINNYLYSRSILTSLFCFIFFQQVFVLNIGGSFKIYEMLGILLIFIWFLEKKHTMTPQIISLFFFFCISPVLSNVLFILFSDIAGYYERFPDAKSSWRYNKNFTIFYTTILCIMNFCIANLVISSRYIYNNRDKIIKLFIITGTAIAIYSLYSFFCVGLFGFPDLFPAFIDARNRPPEKGLLRVSGFCDEPGSYVIIQTICVYYLMFYKKLFKKNINKLFLIINLITIFLTISSALLVMFGGFIFYVFCLSKKNDKTYKNRIYIIIFLLFIVCLGLYINNLTNGLMKYFFLDKIQNFFKSPTNTLDSGAMRAYTSRLGIKVFEDNILFGSGAGCSNYFLYKYEYTFGITSWGERLSKSIYPQNNHSKILAEQGLFGYVSFLCFFISTFFIFFKYKKDDFIKVHILILVSIFIFNSVIYPSTNLYLWLNIYLGLNSIHFMRAHNGNKYCICYG